MTVVLSSKNKLQSIKCDSCGKFIYFEYERGRIAARVRRDQGFPRFKCYRCIRNEERE